MLAFMLCYLNHESIHIQIDSSVQEFILQKLRMYILRSKVSLNLVNETFTCIGFVGSKALLAKKIQPPKNYLDIIQSGTTPPNPAELLDSETFKQLIEYAKTQFDFVIVDCPPTLLVADAAIIAARTDGAVVVTRVAKTKVNQFLGARENLTNVGVNVIGAVMNMIPYSRTESMDTVTYMDTVSTAHTAHIAHIVPTEVMVLTEKKLGITLKLHMHQKNLSQKLKVTLRSNLLQGMD